MFFLGCGEAKISIEGVFYLQQQAQIQILISELLIIITQLHCQMLSIQQQHLPQSKLIVLCQVHHHYQLLG